MSEPRPPEIEITPEMIEAGAAALQEMSDGDGNDRFMLSPEEAHRRIGQILLAMRLPCKVAHAGSIPALTSPDIEYIKG